MAERKQSASLSCEEYTQLASLRMETRVSWRDRLRMLWHEVQCVYCRRFVAQLKRIRQLLRNEVVAKPMPPELRVKIQNGLREKP